MEKFHRMRPIFKAIQWDGTYSTLNKLLKGLRVKTLTQRVRAHVKEQETSYYLPQEEPKLELEIFILGDWHPVRNGYYVILSPEESLYVVKPEAFEKEYEAVE